MPSRARSPSLQLFPTRRADSPLKGYVFGSLFAARFKRVSELKSLWLFEFHLIALHDPICRQCPRLLVVVGIFVAADLAKGTCAGVAIVRRPRIHVFCVARFPLALLLVAPPFPLVFHDICRCVNKLLHLWIRCS